MVPGTTAGNDELFGIADAINKAGGGLFQFAPEHQYLADQEWPWMRELSSRYPDVTVCVNLNQADEAPHVWKDVLKKLDEAHADGLNLMAQVAGRSIGVLMCLEGSFHPLAFHPAWQEIAHLPLADKVKALQTRELRDKFREMPRDGGFFEKIVWSRLWKFFPQTGANMDYEPDPKTDSVEAIAARTRTEPMDLMIDHLLQNGGRGIIYLPFFNYNYGDLSMTHDLLASPRTKNGLSDAGAHCGAIADGGMPTFMLTHWVRDRKRGPRHSLEYMVHRQTRDTAMVFGLEDRGLIAPGLRAGTPSHVVNVASVNGLIANDPRLVLTAAYVTTKHGLVGLTKQLAAEWGRHGITVNALCPGFFPSKMTRATLDKDGAFLVAGTPTGRLGGDQDLKGAAVLLASDAGAHITGHALVVDGGASII